MSEADLMGLYEVAELAGVSPSAVANWRSRNIDFPKPVAELKSGPVFRAGTIRDWLKRRKEANPHMGTDAVRIGLRLLEFECGVETNIDDMHSAELVDYEASRTAGQAARLAMLVRGQDVIDDEQHLKKVASHELGMTPPEYNAAKRLLQEVDLIEERTTRLGKYVLNEKVQRVIHGENYRRIGERWLQLHRTPKEEALISTLDKVIDCPTDTDSIEGLRALKKPDKSAVLELGRNAGIIDSVDQSNRIYYSPLLWDVNREELAAFLKLAGDAGFNGVLEKARNRPGADFTRAADDKAADRLLAQAISGGILPSYRVTSTGGPRLYGFAPYTGGLLTTDTERTTLDKARALVACLRYGGEAAVITRIRNPLWILNAITDASRGYRLKPHSELKLQYGMLIGKQLGKIIKTNNNRYMFELISSDDNLRACAIARELLSTGEIIGEKDPGTTAGLHLVNGTIQHPLREVNRARRKRPARVDELEGLIEHLRAV